MGIRYRNWITALVVTVVVMAMAIPRSILFDPAEWSRAFRQHAWLAYFELPLYLAGILLVTVVFAVCSAWLGRYVFGIGLLTSALKFALRSGALLGLSPLQPVFANVILILLVPTLAGTTWFPFEGLRWVLTTTLVGLLGLTLGCDLALRAIDERPVGGRAWMRALAQVTTEQSSALAGRLLVIIMAGPLLAGTIAALGIPTGQPELGVTRFTFPVETIFVGFVAVPLTYAIWLAARRTGGPPASLEHQLPGATMKRQLLAWAIVALAFIAPLSMLVAADDPLLQRVDRVQESPSAEHRFGTDAIGRDVFTRLAFAWRDIIYSGISIGIVLFGIGIAWRVVVPFDRSLVIVETVIERLPPGVLFFGVWGIVLGLSGGALSIRSVAIASGIILIPAALRLIRNVELPALPAAGFGLAMLATLLVLGWSTVLGLLGLIEPPIPNFGEALGQSREFRIEAPWLARFTALVLLMATALPALALSALAGCYGIPRHWLRLQG